jgi:mRNA deadenylase 3'-5' endonuclease subunit Ccr4
MSFRVVTWNVLATSYIRSSFYPLTAARCLEPARRHPAIVERALALDADVLCLQEVEPEVFDALRRKLAGYVGELALKEGKPDGCATFVRSVRCSVLEPHHRLVYSDGSGHIAQLTVADHEGRRVAVVNTHLKWDPPHTSVEKQWGMGQIREALELFERTPSDGAILCGDLNVTEESDVVRALRAAGFEHAHHDVLRGTRTCNSSGVPKLIDYVFFRRSLRATPQLPREIDEQTALPSDEEPSDHLALGATFALTV